MASVQMRNKLSGEIRDIEADSDEFYELRAEVTPTGQSMWEQTNVAHAEAVRDRAVHEELLDEDLGHEAQGGLMHEALRLDATGVAPEANPHLSLTPGEVEAGLTPKQKLEDLRSQFDDDTVERRNSIFNEAAEKIRGDREAEPRPAAAPAKGLRARAGGSDDREGVTLPQARDEEHDGASDSPQTGSNAGQSPLATSAPAAGTGATTEGDTPAEGE